MNAFEAEIYKSLSEQLVDERGGFAHRFAQKQFHGHPADFICLLNGRPLLIECKSVRNPTRFELRYIKSEQRDELTNWINCGGESWLFINDRSTPQSYKMYALRINDNDELLFSWKKASISWGELANMAYSIPRIYPQRWDLSLILDM